MSMIIFDKHMTYKVNMQNQVGNSSVACALRNDTEERDSAELQMQCLWGLRISIDKDVTVIVTYIHGAYQMQ